MQRILVLIINTSNTNYFEMNWNTSNIYVMRFEICKEALGMLSS